MSLKVLIMYYSRTGNTEKLAEAVAEGVKRVSGVAVELKRAERARPKRRTQFYKTVTFKL